MWQEKVIFQIFVLFCIVFDVRDKGKIMFEPTVTANCNIRLTEIMTIRFSILLIFMIFCDW